MSELDLDAIAARHWGDRETDAVIGLLIAECRRLRAKAEDYEDRYETAHASRMHAENCFRRAERERDEARTALDRAKGIENALLVTREFDLADKARAEAAIARVEALLDPMDWRVHADDVRAALRGEN